MTRTKSHPNASGGAAQGNVTMNAAERAFDNNFAPKKKRKPKPTHLERLAECNISEELRVSIALALKKLETSDEQKAELELPSSLTSEERKYIHIVAQQMGFKSKSRGPKECRTPTVSKRDPKEQPVRVKSWKRRALRYGGVAELIRQKEERGKVRELEREHERLIRIEEAKELIGGSSGTETSEENSNNASSNVDPDFGGPDGKNNTFSSKANPSGRAAMLATPEARKYLSNNMSRNGNGFRAMPPKAFGQPCRRYSNGDSLQSGPLRDSPHFTRHPPPVRDNHSVESRVLQQQPRRGYNNPFHGGELNRQGWELHHKHGEGPYPMPSSRNVPPVAAVRPCSPLRPPKLEIDDSTWIMLNANDKSQPLRGLSHGPLLMPAVNVPPPPILYGQPFSAPPNITQSRNPPVMSEHDIPATIPRDWSFSHHRYDPHQPHEPNYAEVAGRNVPHRPHGPHYAAASSRPFHQQYKEMTLHGGDVGHQIHPNQHHTSDHFTGGDRDRDIPRRHSTASSFGFGEHLFDYDPAGLVISPSEPADPCYGYYTRGNEPRSGDTPQPGTAAQVKQEAMTTFAAPISLTDRKYNSAEVKFESPSSGPFSSCTDVSLFGKDSSISDLERQERDILSVAGVADTDDVFSSDDDEQREGETGPETQHPPLSLDRLLVSSDLQAPQHRSHNPKRSWSESNGEFLGYELRNSDAPLDSTKNKDWKREPTPDLKSIDDVPRRWSETGTVPRDDQ